MGLSGHELFASVIVTNAKSCVMCSLMLRLSYASRKTISAHSNATRQCYMQSKFSRLGTSVALPFA